MEITLELSDNQECIDKYDPNSSVWLFKVNGQLFPCEHAYMSLTEAHRMACKLFKIQEKFENE